MENENNTLSRMKAELADSYFEELEQELIDDRPLSDVMQHLDGTFDGIHEATPSDKAGIEKDKVRTVTNMKRTELSTTDNIHSSGVVGAR